MKTTHLGWLLIMGLSSFSLAGCEDATGPSRMLPLDGDVVFQVFEGYGAIGEKYPRGEAVSNPRVALDLRTAKVYSCSNWELVYEKTVSNNRINIHFLGRRIGPMCLTSIGPASTRLFLDLGMGVYELAFEYGNELAIFSLSVTDSALSVTPGEDTFMASEYDVYWRHPQKSFACFCGTTTETRSLCDEFVARVAAAVHIEEFAFPTQGEPPWALISSGHYYEAPTRFFRYSEESDFRAAGVVLETFSREVIGAQQGIGISLWSWRNDRYLSWLYRDP